VIGRHIASRILSSFIVILAVLTVSLAAMQIVRLGPLFLGAWVRLADAACLVGLVPFIAVGAPAALALATAAVASSMSRRGERQAIAAAGVRSVRVAAPALVLALAAFLATGALAVTAVPACFALLERSLASLAVRASLGSLPAGRFFELPGGGVLLASGRRDTDGGGVDLEGLVVGYEAPGGPDVFVTARSARILHSGDGTCTFALEGATVDMTGSDGGEVRIRAGIADLPVDLGALIRSRRDAVPPVLGTPTSALWAGSRGSVETHHLHRRLSLPVASLAIMLVAVSFLLLPVVRRPAVPPAAIAGLIVVYNGLVRACEEASRAGMADAALSAWLPAAVMWACLGAAALVVSRRILPGSRPAPSTAPRTRA